MRILADLGLPDMDSRVLSCGEEYGSCPGANLWLRLAENMMIPPSRCVAIATSAASCKAAIAAKMRSVVIPDKFTAFQDFGGADVVFDTLDKNAIGVHSGSAEINDLMTTQLSEARKGKITPAMLSAARSGEYDA